MCNGYFKGKLNLVIRDIELYTKEELARELARLAKTADESVFLESEFSEMAQQNIKQDDITEDELKANGADEAADNFISSRPYGILSEDEFDVVASIRRYANNLRGNAE